MGLEVLFIIVATALWADMITFWFTPFTTLKERMGPAGDWTILNCPKCCGLWLGLVVGFMTYGVVGALIVAPTSSLLAMLMFHVIAKYDA